MPQLKQVVSARWTPSRPSLSNPLDRDGACSEGERVRAGSRGEQFGLNRNSR